mgnify:CR=1 FL=1
MRHSVREKEGEGEQMKECMGETETTKTSVCEREGGESGNECEGENE